jgi:hypothetical protein
MSIPGRGKRLSSARRPGRLWGPPRVISDGYVGAFSPEANRPVYEANHSPQSSAEVKNTWSYTSTPLYVLTAGAELSTGTTCSSIAYRC